MGPSYEDTEVLKLLVSVDLVQGGSKATLVGLLSLCVCVYI